MNGNNVHCILTELKNQQQKKPINMSLSLPMASLGDHERQVTGRWVPVLGRLGKGGQRVICVQLSYGPLLTHQGCILHWQARLEG